MLVYFFIIIFFTVTYMKNYVMKLIYYLQGQDALSWLASLTYETSSP